MLAARKAMVASVHRENLNVFMPHTKQYLMIHSVYSSIIALIIISASMVKKQGRNVLAFKEHKLKVPYKI